jgi:hypothetical protein
MTEVRHDRRPATSSKKQPQVRRLRRAAVRALERIWTGSAPDGSPAREAVVMIVAVSRALGTLWAGVETVEVL